MIIANFILWCSVLFLSIGSAYAYLDPGSGSYILQVVIGAIAGSIFTIKHYWVSIKAYFINLKNKNKK